MIVVVILPSVITQPNVANLHPTFVICLMGGLIVVLLDVILPVNSKMVALVLRAVLLFARILIPVSLFVVNMVVIFLLRLVMVWLS